MNEEKYAIIREYLFNCKGYVGNSSIRLIRDRNFKLSQIIQLSQIVGMIIDLYFMERRKQEIEQESSLEAWCVCYFVPASDFS